MAQNRTLFRLYGALLITAGLLITVSQLGTVAEVAQTKPEFWLMSGLATLAGVQAFVAARPGGNSIIICPTTCFTFAILLCWGLGPAIVAQLAAIVVVASKHRLPVMQSLIVAGQYIVSFGAAELVLRRWNPDPFGKHGEVDLLRDALATVGAVGAWLAVFGLLTVVDYYVRNGRRRRQAASVVGDQILFKAALLLLSPVFAVAAHVNIAFVPLVFVPLFAVERMARLSAERDRASRLDPLTGLANRNGLKARFDELTETGATTPLALLVLDLDRFKHVNDGLGHEAGDRVLVTVAERLRGIEPEGGVVARLGGDEFAVLGRVSDANGGVALADRVVLALEEPIALDELRLDVTTSIGIAVRTAGENEDFATLMRHADIAMYEAKQRGDTACGYQPHTDTNTPERFSLLSDFRRALENGDRDQIQLHYQPQVRLDTGQVVGVEALLRWMHPSYGAVNPQELLRIAEHTAVMRLLTFRVIDDAVAQVGRWRAAGLSLRASVNVSARDLFGGELVGHLAEQLRRHRVPPELIQVEITESALMTDPARARATTRRIAELGVGVALDDFGTGYSSMQHLRKLPLAEVKVDRSFVAGMAANADDAAIVTSIVGLARSLGLRTVAEGVENEYTRRLLTEAGCTLAQGWLHAPAMSGAALTAWLAENTDKTAREPIGAAPPLKIATISR